MDDEQYDHDVYICHQGRSQQICYESAQAHISWMTWEYKMQQGNHDVSQSMHKMQICHVYDMSIEHDMCEHNQQIWRCWCTNAQCHGMSGGSKLHPISPSAPQLEGPWSQSPRSLLCP